jgi:hypothetical protein
VRWGQLRFSTAARPLKLQSGKVDLGEVPKAEHCSDVYKFDERAMKRAGAWALGGHSCDRRIC